MPRESWAIDIDIEGFSELWDKDDQTLWSLGELMRAIFRVGSRCFPEPPDRLFAHHVGDGFFIVSDFHESNLDRCIAISVALMRHVAHAGRFAKASISEGGLSGITGCYPKEVMDSQDRHDRIRLGAGLMTVFPVMGTSIINARAVAKNAPSGPLLTLPAEFASRFSASIPTKRASGRNSRELLVVDWVHYDEPLLRQLQTAAGLEAPSSEALASLLRSYCAGQTNLPPRWSQGVAEFLNVPLRNRET